MLTSETCMARKALTSSQLFACYFKGSHEKLGQKECFLMLANSHYQQCNCHNAVCQKNSGLICNTTKEKKMKNTETDFVWLLRIAKFKWQTYCCSKCQGKRKTISCFSLALNLLWWLFYYASNSAVVLRAALRSLNF